MNLDEIAVGRVLIVGIGNRQRGDDGVGPVFIDLQRVFPIYWMLEQFLKIIQNILSNTARIPLSL